MYLLMSLSVAFYHLAQFKRRTDICRRVRFAHLLTRRRHSSRVCPTRSFPARLLHEVQCIGHGRLSQCHEQVRRCGEPLAEPNRIPEAVGPEHARLCARIPRMYTEDQCLLGG